MDARLQYLTTPDKIRLYYEFWVPDNPKAIVVFVHGLGDHMGAYAEFMKHLLKNNLGICFYDQRGHGKSSGRRAHCRRFEDFLRDLSQVIEMVQNEYPQQPVFLIGHSFGGQVALNFVGRYSKGLRGLVALSPNLEPLVKIPQWKKKFCLWLSRWIPILRLQTNIDPENFSHDLGWVEAVQADAMRYWHVTTRLGAEILKNLDQIPKLAFQVKVPCLFLHGGDDHVCSLDATRKFYHSVLVQNKDFRTYPGLYHELLHETEREKVMSHITSWIDGQITSFKRLARSNGEATYETKKNNPDLWHHIGSAGRT